MTPGAAGTASYRTRGETVTQDETDVAARLAEVLEADHHPAELPCSDCRRDVARLLPVVRMLQAEELEAAAEELGQPLATLFLTQRAATLRGEAGR